MILNTVRAWLVAGIIVVLLAGFGVRMYGNARVAGTEKELLGEAVSEAVQQRKDDLKADASVASENRARVDSVRAVTRKAKEKLRVSESEVKGVSGSDCAGPCPEFSRVLNDAIAASNRAVESARSLPR